MLKRSLSLSLGGRQLFNDADVSITEGSKYGLVGKNGIGKTTLLRFISEQLAGNSVFLEQTEIDNFDERTVYDMVISVNVMRKHVLKRLTELEEDEEVDLEEYQKVAEASNLYNSDEGVVRRILHGLGFDAEKQSRPTGSFSGGWRMRILLARALYMNPPILLLDEPTNHLDLEGVLWLEMWLSKVYRGTLVAASHSPSFLNSVCSHIVAIRNRKIFYYKGSYDSYKKQSAIEVQNQEKEWNKVQKRIKEMKRKSVPKKKVQDFIDSQGLTRPEKEYHPAFVIPQIPEIEGNIVEMEEVGFHYESGEAIIKEITLGIDHRSRITIVGPNGCGKTTLFKLIYGALSPTSGSAKRDHRLRTVYLQQHADLPDHLTPLEYLEQLGLRDFQEKHKLCGMFGLETRTSKIGDLSGGQRVRLLFIALYLIKPHLILLDEPTNHLDVESVDSLIEAINATNAGIILITHEPRLIEATNSRVMLLREGGLEEVSYSDYVESVLEE